MLSDGHLHSANNVSIDQQQGMAMKVFIHEMIKGRRDAKQKVQLPLRDRTSTLSVKIW